MNIASLNPLRLFGATRAAAPTGRKALPGEVVERDGSAEGPWTEVWRDWVPREVNPYLYEAIREAVAPIDGAINRLVTLDGIIRVGGDNDRLVSEIEEWMANVRVNDLENGFQSFYRSQGNEFYEQGFSVGDPVLDGRNGVVRLRVADSKGVIFRRADDELETWYRKPAPQRGRRDGTDQIERVLRNTYRNTATLAQMERHGFRQMDAARLAYAVFNPEADGPYGTSIMRSTEFDARVLLIIKNALANTWDRFGDPIFNVVYKTKAKKTEAELKVRENTIASNLASALNIKRKGNSADVVNAVGKDDELSVEVLGANGQILEVEMPARHILESIVSKTGLPSWMLGFHWSTAERLAQRQGEIALQESKTRFATRRPGLRRIVETHLRARGRSWRSSDWFLYQDLPSLQDLVAQAQSVFLYTQSAAVLENAGLSLEDMERIAKDAGIGSMLPDHGVKALAELVGNKISRREGGALRRAVEKEITRESGGTASHSTGCGCSAGAKTGKSDHPRQKAETYVEDESALMRLERSTERALLKAWDDLYDQTLDALELDRPKSAKAPDPVFIFDRAASLSALLELEDQFVASVGGEDAELARNNYRAWVRGVDNAAAEFEAGDAVDEQARAVQRQAIATAGMEQVRDTAARAFRDDILKELQDGAYDGQNPTDVARALRKRFAGHEYDWERLARSEIAQAQASGKLSQYAAHDVEEYDWIPAGDSCPICTGKAAGGPYPVGGGPLPMRDSHPNCRCTVAAAT